MNQTINESNNIPQIELDLPALLMRMETNQIALWKGWPVALYPTTRITPEMHRAIHVYASDLHHIADRWGIKACIRQLPEKALRC